MKIINDTPLVLAPFAFQIEPPQFSMCLVAKATFDLRHEGVAVLAEEAEPLNGDLADEQTSLCRYPTDFAPFKPAADVLMVGHAHAKRAKPTSSCEVAFQLGETKSTLLVSGDRHWLDERKTKASDPELFVTMPLSYARAFGGDGHAPNPAGMGKAAGEGGVQPLPNIEHPPPAVAGTSPAGFGPLPSIWALRANKMGTYDEVWLQKRWPWFPADFDSRHFNVAPSDLQVDGYLRGAEELTATGVHAEHHTYRCRLPGLVPRVFVHSARGDTEAFVEAPMKLDTAWVDMDHERLVLVWRGHVAVDSERYEEVEHIYATSESLDGRRATVAEHQQIFDVRRGAGPDVAPVEPPANDNVIDDEEAAAERARAAKEAREAAEQKDRAETIALLEKHDASPEIIARIKAGEDPSAVLDSILTANPGAAERLEELKRKADEEINRLLQEAGHDPSALDDKPPPKKKEPEAPWTRERVVICLEQQESLADIDLSGLDLSGLDFTRADLSGALLTGVDLSSAQLLEAKLVGASLKGAKLDEARLVRAQLQGADLQGVSATKADFAESDLTDAVLSKAQLSGSGFNAVKATHATFLEAELEGAVFDEADLSGARLARCRIDRATFKGATMCNAVLEGASGEGVELSDADLQGLRASEGTRLPGAIMLRAKAARSLWVGADLSGADLSLGCFDNADFHQANLTKARFIGASMKEADLSRATLQSASGMRCNFAGARLEAANLREADLQDAILYEAELWQADLTDTRLTGAHVAMTKLSSDRGAP
jgi:uncharacterized protein YjbI with pentapeptide repeats